MIKTVYIWQNDMTMVFDERGKQLPDYQGYLKEVYAAIVRDATPQTGFIVGTWKVAGSGHEMSYDEFVARYQQRAREGE